MPRKDRTDALYKRELRGAWERCPTPEVRMLLWEIDRLQQIVVAAERVLTHLCGETWAIDQTITPLLADLQREPAVRWEKRAEERHRARTGTAKPVTASLDHWRYREDAQDPEK